MGGGFGLIYKWLSGIVYVAGTNGAWYRWAGDSWAGAGETEPGGPVPSPTATPSPGSTPQPTPTPVPIPCTMTIVVPVLQAWGSGKLTVTLTGIPKTSTISATATSGQVTVMTAPQTINLGSAIVEIQLQAKRKSSNVTVSGPCGSQTVLVNVQ